MKGDQREGALRVLHIGRAPSDVVMRELKRVGLALEVARVPSLNELDEALRATWDVVIAEDATPSLDLSRVLASVRRVDAEVPFIVISATIGAESAAALVRAGANDILHSDDLPRLASAITREVTLRRARTSRRHADETFGLIVERSPDLVVVHRAERIVYANPTAAARLGYPDVASILGEPLAAIVFERGAPLEGSPYVEERWKRLDGTTILVEVARQDVTFEGERSAALLARDVTERQQILAETIEIDRMAAFGTLVAGVGHEINNPLAYVLANLEFVNAELGAVVAGLPASVQESLAARIADLRQALADTHHGARRVRDIVQDLRTYARSDDGKVRLVDIRQLLDVSLHIATAQIRHRATIVKEYGDCPPALANESRLGQVFLSLILQLVQSLPNRLPSENRIVVRTGHDAGDALVEMIDNAGALPPETIARIFDPSFTIQTAGQGKGLGMSSCRRIIRALGGDVTVATTSAGQTHLVIRVPSASTASSRPAKVEPAQAAAPTKARILCVDDEPALVVALKRVLGSAHDVVVLTSAAAARDCVAAGQRFDAILCDLMMPEMTGMDLYDAIVGIAPEQARRMLFLSGGAATARASDFLASVRNPRLEKPVSVDTLRTAVEQMLAS